MSFKKIKKSLSVFLLVNLTFSIFLIPMNCVRASNVKTIVITFATPPTSAVVTKAPLKYNKDFAFSYSFDDGLIRGYDTAFKYMNGGYSDYLGQYFSGLYFTDGAGNNVPFRAGYAFYARNGSYSDIHINTPSYIKWTQLQDAVDNGWNVFNHGYTSASLSINDPNNSYYVGDPGGHAVGALDYAYELSQENIEVASHINLKNNAGAVTGSLNMSHVVLPNGDDNYIQPAFDGGAKGVYAQSPVFPFTDGATTINAPDFTNVTNSIPTTGGRHVMPRWFDYETRYLAGGSDPGGLLNHIDDLAAQSTGSTKLWTQQFTHQITTSTYLPDANGGMTWSSWKSLMDHIENTYGRFGNDKAWVAGAEEVYNYLMVKQNSTVSSNLVGNQLTVDIDVTNVPANLNNYALSLIISSDASISSIDYGSSFTYHTDNKTTGLINLDWGVNSYSKNDITRVETLVTTAESSKRKSDVDMAKNYVNLLPSSGTKTTYTNRLNAIIIPLRTWYVKVRGGITSALNCNSTNTTTYSPSVYNWNTFYVGKNSLICSDLTNLKDSDNQSSGMSLSNTAAFDGGLQSNPTGNNSGIYPDAVLDSSPNIYKSAATPAKIKIYGLENNKTYNIKLFGYTSASLNNNAKDYTDYKIGVTTKPLKVAGNISQTVDFSDILPTSGEIEISVVPQNPSWGYGMLNAMEIKENLLAAPSSLSYTASNVYTKNTAITPLSPTISGQGITYSVSPTLPIGLSLDTSTGIISGTPSATTGLATYTVTATNTGGSTTFGVVITVNDIAQHNVSYTISYLSGNHGALTGSSTQIVIEGRNTVPITAIANLGYHFVDWSDGILTATRNENNVREDKTLTANFSIDILDIKNNSSSAPVNLPPAMGNGNLDVSIPINTVYDISSINNHGTNVLAYINSQANFNAPESSRGWQFADHSFKITDLNLATDVITLTIFSEPQTITLKKGESREIDLDGDKINDLLVTFANTYVNRAEVTVKSLSKKNTTNSLIGSSSIQSIIKPLKVNKYIFKKDLKLGDIDKDVKELQKYLNINGYLVAKVGVGSNGRETTIFGPATKIALIKFQKANKINPALGYFGALTRNAIYKKQNK